MGGGMQDLLQELQLDGGQMGGPEAVAAAGKATGVEKKGSKRQGRASADGEVRKSSRSKGPRKRYNGTTTCKDAGKEGGAGGGGGKKKEKKEKKTKKRPRGPLKGAGPADGGEGGGVGGLGAVVRPVHSLARTKTRTPQNLRENTWSWQMQQSRRGMTQTGVGSTPELAVARFLIKEKKNTGGIRGIVQNLASEPREGESTKTKKWRSDWQQAREGLRSAAYSDGAAQAGYGDDWGTVYDVLREFLEAWDASEGESILRKSGVLG